MLHWPKRDTQTKTFAKCVILHKRYNVTAKLHSLRAYKLLYKRQLGYIYLTDHPDRRDS